MFSYPVNLVPDDNDTVLLTFPDVPGTLTFGDDADDAVARGVDALETMIIGLMSDRQDIPVPSRPAPGQRTVTLPALSAAKVALYQAMRSQGVRKAELGRRLGLHMPQIDRLLDLRHASRLDQIETALRSVGKSLVIDVRDAA
jgi:antitoxin HicB